MFGDKFLQGAARMERTCTKREHDEMDFLASIIFILSAWHLHQEGVQEAEMYSGSD